MSSAVLAQVDSPPVRAEAEPDTEHMFGFTEGADIGRRGDLEGEIETIGRFGRQANAYNVISTTPTLKYGVTDQFRIAPAVTFSNYSLSGFDAFQDRGGVRVDAVSAEFRYHPLDRASAPIGLTFVATPFLGFTNFATGAPADGVGAAFVVVADRALVPGQLFATVNVSYQLERERDQATGATFDSSILGFSAAASRRLLPWLYLGAEARYLRSSSGLALSSLAGQALYLGPVFYATIVPGVSVSGAWDVQAWGQAAGAGGALDHLDFERNQVKLRLSIGL